MKLEGKVALVAGGGQGIGEGIALCLAEEGADLAIADIHGKNAGMVAGKAEAMGRKALALQADLTDEKQIAKVVQDTVDTFGRIDILVNNVGGVISDTAMKAWSRRGQSVDERYPGFLDFDAKMWDGYFALNLKSHVMLSQAVAPHFIKQHDGNIINISSVSGRLPEPGHMPYGAMKTADISITWSLARALAPYNVRVNCICPGHVYTPLWDKGATARFNEVKQAAANGKKLPYDVPLEEIEKLTPREFWLTYQVKPITPLGREQTARDMGRAVVFFVSDDAKNITGQTLHVDGGMVMR